ncbi:MAG: hypothetical protein Q9188_002280 [Gyalolechia gomerana]
MAEAIAVISFTSAVISLLDAGARVLNRLREFSEASNEVPESFRHLNAQLPIVLDGLRRTEASAKAGNVDQRTQEALVPTVQGCRDRIQDLYRILESVLPSKTDSSIDRAIKAAKSLSKDKKVQKLLKDVDSYLTSLTFHNTSGDTVSSSPSVPGRRVNMTPVDRDKRFVDRPDVFHALDATLKEHGRAAVAGFGGVGLELPGSNDPRSDTLRTLHAWLSEGYNGSWMLVVDNADDIEILDQPLPSENGPKSLLQLIPHREHGRVLVTTRDRRVGERLAVRGRTVIVPPMSLSEGRTLLISYLPNARDDEKGGLDDLVGKLDCLPLAISQAAAYITENYVDVADYLALLGEGGEEMEALLSESFSDHRRGEAADNSVLKTWKISFDHITRRFSRAADMLSLMSMYDRQGVPEDLLRKEGEPKHNFINALATLQNFSLIGRTTSGGSYHMHRLVQIAIRTWLQLKGTLLEWKEVATCVLSMKFPSGEYGTWAACDLLIPHVRAVLEPGQLPRESLLKRAELLEKVARFDTFQDRWLLGHTRAIEAATLFEQILGPEAPQTLSCKGDTAYSLLELEEPRKAEQILVDIMPAMERVYGPNHLERLRNQGGQGWAKYCYGDFEAADTLLQAVADKCGEIWGPMHPDTLQAMNDVAANAAEISSEGVKKAVNIGRKVLAARIEIFGPDHIDDLETQGDLAEFLNSIGDHDESERYFKSTIAAQNRVYGAGNPGTLTLTNNLAVCYSRQSRYEEAVELEKAVLSQSIKVLGEDNINTLILRDNLVYDLENIGQEYEEIALQSRLILNYRDVIERSQRPFTKTLVPNAEKSLERALERLKARRYDGTATLLEESVEHLSIEEKN